MKELKWRMEESENKRLILFQNKSAYQPPETSDPYCGLLRIIEIWRRGEPRVKGEIGISQNEREKIVWKMD